MGKNYTESYKGLHHGTTATNANLILKNGFEIRGDNNNSWCGPGVYFYLDKSKAYWAANRKCEEHKKENREIPKVLIADIINLPCDNILDLRRKDCLQNLNSFIKALDGENIDIKTHDNIELSNEEKIIKLRAMYISFYCAKNEIDLVIGEFKQRDNGNINNSLLSFAESFNMIYGTELMFCAKKISIISNVCLI